MPDLTETDDISLTTRARRVEAPKTNSGELKLIPRILVVDDDDLARRQLDRLYSCYGIKGRTRIQA